jgi:hypothetical protein
MSAVRGSGNTLITMPGRLAGAYATFVGESWRRTLGIGGHYLGRAARVTAEAAGVRQPESDLLRMALQGAANAAVEFATVPVAAYGEALGTWERSGAPRSGDPSRLYLVNGRPVLLPLRFARARQGWALYAVDPALAATALAAHGLDGPFVVHEVAGRALLIVYGIDFLETDLGAYLEIGVELWARARDKSLAGPGIVTLAMAVNPAGSIAPARQIWNFAKLEAPGMAVRYERDEAAFVLDAREPRGFSLTLPRFGKGRSTRVPVRYLTPSPHGAAGTPLCGVLRRSAEGEGVQFGGAVRLQLGSGTAAGSFGGLGGPATPDTCQILRTLGLPGLTPVANGWAEHMSGEMAGP